MKKLIAGAVALTISGSAMAAASSVGFSFGTNFFSPSAPGLVADNGQNFTINWALDNDVSLGVYTELSNVNLTGALSTLTVNAIQVSKGVMKNVSVGLNLGSGTTTANSFVAGPPATGIAAGTAPLADIFGSVNILSGSGDKVSGSLSATVAARFSKVGATTTVGNLNGVNVGLAVGIMF